MVHHAGGGFGLDITGVTSSQVKGYFPDYHKDWEKLRKKGVKKVPLSGGFRFKIFKKNGKYELVLYHKGKVDKRLPNFPTLDKARTWAKKYAHEPITFTKVSDTSWQSGTFRD